MHWYPTAVLLYLTLLTGRVLTAPCLSLDTITLDPATTGHLGWALTQNILAGASVLCLGIASVLRTGTPAHPVSTTDAQRSETAAASCLVLLGLYAALTLALAV